MKALSAPKFRERLFRIMDRKHHWAWPRFADGTLTKAQLKIHCQQEYAVYDRDFPVFLARLHGQNPPPSVRRMLAKNIDEEETGRLSLGTSHPALFLVMMEGLGFSANDFESAPLLPTSRTYRTWLDTASERRPWVVGAAVLAIFVEGSPNDRREMLAPSPPNTKDEVEAAVAAHPLVRQYRVARSPWT
jgi:pyrroloquinoline-quinone synthase